MKSVSKQAENNNFSSQTMTATKKEVQAQNFAAQV